MRLFISPYILLALASSSALAVPLIAERDGGSSNIPRQDPALVGRQPLNVNGPGPELNSLPNVQPVNNIAQPSNNVVQPSNNMYQPSNYDMHNDISCGHHQPHEQNEYLETVNRRRSYGPSDISERAAAKKISTKDLFRYFFRKALLNGKKGGKK